MERDNFNRLIKIIDKKIDCIEVLKKEIAELKEENKNLNWMITKQFEHSFKEIRENKTQ